MNMFLDDNATGKAWDGILVIMICMSIATCSMRQSAQDSTEIAYGGTANTVKSLIFSPDGKTLISGNNNQVLVWNAKTGELLNTLKATVPEVSPIITTDGNIHGSICISPDGKIAVSTPWDGHHRILVWDVQKGELLHTLTGHERWIWAAAFSPDSNILASGGAQMAILLWDIQTGSILGILEQADPMRSLAFSPDGEVLAAGSFVDSSTGQSAGTIYLWNIQTRKILHTLRGHERSVECIAFSPDGGILVSGSSDGTIRLWDVETGRQLKALMKTDGQVASAAFSPDGRIVASGDRDGSVRLWDVETGVLLKKMQISGAWPSSKQKMVSSVAFSSDGRILAVGMENGTVQLWNAGTGEQLKAMKAPRFQ